MSTWHDILTVPPDDGASILARRYPEDTPPLYGQWSLANNGLLLPALPTHSGPWSIPWTFLTDWRHTPTAPPYPAIGSPKGWRDVYFYPPKDGQSVWLRRLAGLAAAVPAVYSASDGTFAITTAPGITLTGPWFCFYEWKPM